MEKIVGFVGCLMFVVVTIFFIIKEDGSLPRCPKCHKSVNMDLGICPKDNAPLNGYKYWFWSRGRPMPKMAYPAETYLYKGKDGKFYWSPYEVDLSDFGSENK